MAKASIRAIKTSPAAPVEGDQRAGSLEQARNLANYGNADGASDHDFDLRVPPAVAPTMQFDWGAVLGFLHACETSVPRVKYGLGCKIPGNNAVPGVDFKAVDCSGFVRALVLRYVTPHVAFPDGSAVQHDWVAHQGFAPSTYADGKLADGKVRIAFLNKEDTSDDIGHVLLIRNGATVESHGGVGPDSRTWGSKSWMAKMHVFVLEG